MIVIFDTTEFYNRLCAEGTSWDLLKEWQFRDETRVLVPRIVIEETVNHFREKLDEAAKKARAELENISGLLRDETNWQYPTIYHDQEVLKFEQGLLSQLANVRAEYPGYDGIELKSLVARALRRRKPFDSGGKDGFRDAILWETILRILQTTDDKVTFITANKGDFGDGKPVADLAEDLKKLGIADDRISVCKSLSLFATDHVKPTLEKLEEVREAIQDGTFPKFNAAEFFVDICEDAIFEVIAESFKSWAEIPAYYFNQYPFSLPRLTALSPTPEDFEVEDVSRLRNDRLALSMTYQVKVTITCNKVEESGNGPLTSEFSGSVIYHVRMSVILDPSYGVDDFEVNEDLFWQRGPEWPPQL